MLLVEGESTELVYENLNAALEQPDTQLRLFGKPEVAGRRRMGVSLALGDSIDDAKQKAIKASESIKPVL